MWRLEKWRAEDLKLEFPLRRVVTTGREIPLQWKHNFASAVIFTAGRYKAALFVVNRREFVGLSSTNWPNSAGSLFVISTGRVQYFIGAAEIITALDFRKDVPRVGFILWERKTEKIPKLACYGVAMCFGSSQ